VESDEVVICGELKPVVSSIENVEIDELRARVEELARWRSTQAPRIEALEGLKNHYQELADRGVEANKTLASEREANAILTAEVDALRARVAELEKDASRYRWLRDIQKCWDFADSTFFTCSSEEHDAAIDAARGE
jgi:chromosome segregation ATPase